jgi:solute carrier family 25 (mitochondrial carnitine/acylcarnitine transporter), member 20/29
VRFDLWLVRLFVHFLTLTTYVLPLRRYQFHHHAFFKYFLLPHTTTTCSIKCLMQTSAPGQYKGMVDCAQTVYRTGGIRSVFKGTVLTLMRDVPGSIAWFGTYEFVKQIMSEVSSSSSDPTKKELSPLAIMAAGGLAGVANWTLAIPPDVLKSRFQSAPEGTYSSIFDVYRQLMKTEGPAALFAGLKPAMIRAFPANAACFLGMEWARSMLAFMD